MKDILERLLSRATHTFIIQGNPNLYYDAAHEIERLRERLAEADEANRRVSDESEKLRHELITSSDAAKYYDYGYSCARDMQKDEITRLRAENEKLREALKPFANYYTLPTFEEIKAAAATLKESGE